MSGYIGWLEKEDQRVLRQVMREVYPSVRELEAERSRTSLRSPHKSRADRTTPQERAVDSDNEGV